MIWGNGGMVISRRKLNKLGEVSAATPFHASHMNPPGIETGLRGEKPVSKYSPTL
jgi:hypothetical protein